VPGATTSFLGLSGVKSMSVILKTKAKRVTLPASTLCLCSTL
jgi:hypothetical protein